ncbi:MAG: diadenylate cyclase CdaA [Lachnospiraceae bacterium]|nr:diadenylate cyclase CdaA [Lachnospiraceae bacterium]
MDTIRRFITNYMSVMPVKVTVIDGIEILLIAIALYYVFLWVKSTRAWMLVKGLVVLIVVCLFAIIFDMKVILWIFRNVLQVGITALIIVFQPELRKALEQLGRKSQFFSIIPFDDSREKGEKFSEYTVNEIVKAAFELGKTKTGALIVIERDIPLTEYENTGIELDSLISSQLLINIFEHNTPLHDGAIIVKGDRITAATCYLPLSDNMELSKELGTRHRAGVGVSEATDSVTVIVSEETGKVSIAVEGTLIRGVDGDLLKSKLESYRKNTDGKKFRLWKKEKSINGL